MEKVKYYNVNLSGGVVEKLPFLIPPSIGHTISLNGSLYEITVVSHVIEKRPLTEEEEAEQDKRNKELTDKLITTETKKFIEKMSLEIYTKVLKKL